MTRRRWCVRLWVLLACTAMTGMAQERQIRVDAEERVDAITADLERRLRLFDTPGFQIARIFQAGDSLYQLEIETMVGGTITRTREPLSASGLRDFRRRVSDRLRLQAPDVLLDHSGRTTLITGTTLLSLAFYGWMLPELLDLRAEAYTGVYFLTAGAGFLVPYMLTRQSPVTDAMGTMAVHGGVHGLFDGSMLVWILSSRRNLDPSSEIVLVGGMSLAEMIVGVEIARATSMTAGHAGVLSANGFFGSWLGLGAGLGAGLGDGSENILPLGLLGLGGSAAGYLAGNALAASHHWSAGDAVLLGTAGTLGALAVPMFALALDREMYETSAYASIVGMTGGVVTAALLTRSHDYTTAQANLTALGTLGGGLLGLGVGYTFGQDERLPLALSAVGAMAGFSLMVSSFAEDALVLPGDDMSLDVRVNPLGFLADAPAFRAAPHPPPLLSMQLRF